MRRRVNLPPLSARFAAALCAALVLALAVLAACPAAHEWIHGHAAHAALDASQSAHHVPAPDADPDDDGCVVTLFAHGAVIAILCAAVAVALIRVSPAFHPARAAVCIPAPRYRLPPLCGPPQG